MIVGSATLPTATKARPHLAVRHCQRLLTVLARVGKVLDVGCRCPTAATVKAAKVSHDSIYMSATAGADAGSQYCIKDKARVVVVSVRFVHPMRAGLAGFSIGADSLVISCMMAEPIMTIITVRTGAPPPRARPIVLNNEM